MKRLSILVLSAFLAVLLGSTTGRSADDKVAESLEKAKTKFEAEMKKARGIAKEDFDKKLKAAREKGKKDLVDKIKDEQKAFEQHGILSASAPQELQRTVKAQRAAIETAYTTAIKAYTKAKKDDLAAAVETEWKKLQTEGLVSVAPRPELWIPMFNGTDLTGWEPIGKPVVPWKVVDRAIQGENKEKNGNAIFLRTINKEFDDFHIRIEIFCSLNCRSDLYFRVSEAAGTGYAATINSGIGFTGSLCKNNKKIDLFRIMKNADGPRLPEKEWFTVEIIARGYSIATFVNGEKKVEAVDEDKLSDRGQFSLGLFEQGSLIRVRKIEIMPLPPLPPVKK